jgi:sulfite dehydrogenase (quinone) subunit SoeB
MPGMETRPTNKYLPPRKKGPAEASLLAPLLDIKATGVAGWLDRLLGKL